MNPIALVTGGARGIGRSVSAALSREGYFVIATGTRADDIGQASLAAGGIPADRGLYRQSDVRSQADHDALVDTCLSLGGPPEVLVHCAGVAPLVRRDLLDMDPDSLDRLWETNLRGPVLLTCRMAREMIRRKSGVIVFITSVSATRVSRNRGEYCLSKAGASMAAALFAERLAEEGIRVYEVRPGIIRTDMTAPVADQYDERLARGFSPINRWGTPEDVAEAVRLLCTGSLSFSTGDILYVDGGLHLERL